MIGALNVGAKQRLQRVLDANETLSTAHIMKETLRACWAVSGRREAKRVLADWLEQAHVCGIHQITRFAKTLKQHLPGILAFFEHRISTGPLEAFNNNIRVLTRRAYGYRNRRFLMLRILFLHECHRYLTGS